MPVIEKKMVFNFRTQVGTREYVFGNIVAETEEEAKKVLEDELRQIIVQLHQHASTI